METVSITIPAGLFTELYNRYAEETGSTITGCLEQLLAEAQPASIDTASSTQHFMRPGQGTITGRVWEIADEIYRETGEMDREAVVTACMEEGIKLNTASTQFSHWLNAMKESGGDSK